MCIRDRPTTVPKPTTVPTGIKLNKTDIVLGTTESYALSTTVTTVSYTHLIGTDTPVFYECIVQLLFIRNRNFTPGNAVRQVGCINVKLINCESFHIKQHCYV